MPKDNGATYTPASDWAKPYTEGVLFHFPSGNKAIVRPVNMDTFVQNGSIPDSLSPMVSRLINGESFEANKMTREEFLEVCKLHDIFCKTCFIQPRVVDVVTKPGEEITPDQISDSDKQTLFSFMGAPAASLAAFRPFQAEFMDSLVGEQSDTASAE